MKNGVAAPIFWGLDLPGPKSGRLTLPWADSCPDDNSQTARSFVVLGSKVYHELFGNSSPLGRLVRIGGERFRVIGVMESKGQMLGFDLDDAVYIPTSRAMSLFNLESLMEIDVLYREGLQSKTIAAQLKKLLISRHGYEDFTITTQDEMLKVLGSVLDILTLAVGGLGAISLLVGGVGIITIMTIAVNERIPEIGLLRALGADRRQILFLFLGEAVVLAGLGGLAGLIIRGRRRLAARCIRSSLADPYPLAVCALCRNSCSGHRPACRGAASQPRGQPRSCRSIAGRIAATNRRAKHTGNMSLEHHTICNSMRLHGYSEPNLR